MHTRRSGSRRGLVSAFFLTVFLLILETVGGYVSGSLALLSDAGHMAADAGALTLSLLAMWLSAKPPTPQCTFGLRRTEVLVALVNTLSLVAIAVLVLREAYERLLAPGEVDFRPMLGIALAGLLANLLSGWFLKEGVHNLNVRGAYLHVVGDALGSLGVIVAAGVIWLTGWELIDPLISVGISALILYGAWGLLRQTLNVLLEATPPHLSYNDIQDALLRVPGVLDVHDLHIWAITSGFEALSCHVVTPGRPQRQELLEDLKAVLRGRFGIEHVTIQIETQPGCQVDCHGSEGGH